MKEYGPGRRNQQPQAGINAQTLLYEGYSRKYGKIHAGENSNLEIYIF